MLLLLSVGNLPSFLSSIPGSASLTELETIWSPLATHGSPQRAKG